MVLAEAEASPRRRALSARRAPTPPTIWASAAVQSPKAISRPRTALPQTGLPREPWAPTPSLQRPASPLPMKPAVPWQAAPPKDGLPRATEFFRMLSHSAHAMEEENVALHALLAGGKQQHEQQLEAAKARILDLERVNARLIHEQKRRHFGLTAPNWAVAELDGALRKAETERDTLRAERDRLKEQLEHKTRKLREELEQRTTQRDQLHLESEELADELSRTRAEFAQERRELKGEHIQWIAKAEDRDELALRVCALREELEGLKVAMEKEVAGLKEQLEEKEPELRRLRAALACR